MIQTSRILWSDNGTIVDLSVELGNFLSGTYTIPINAAQDYIYVGSDFPFNHRWFEISTVNALASAITVHLWDGNDWEQALDKIDQTSVAGATLAQSGVLSWYPDPDAGGWKKDNTNHAGSQITGLSSVKIFDLYWARLTFSADLTAGTALKYVGHKFCNDEDLQNFYPEFSNSAVKSQFQSGKTNWNDQVFQATSEIIKDLKKQGIIFSPNQILAWDSFKSACAHKTAAIVWQAFGKDYYPNADRAEKMYKDALDQSIYLIDETNDATLNTHERKARVEMLGR